MKQVLNEKFRKENSKNFYLRFLKFLLTVVSRIILIKRLTEPEEVIRYNRKMLYKSAEVGKRKMEARWVAMRIPFVPCGRDTT